MPKRLVIMVAAFTAATPLMADTETVGGYTWTYRINGDTVEISGVSPAKGAVTIPSSLCGKPVTVISDYAFKGCNGLTDVTIPNCVTNVGKNVFEGCSDLARIIVPVNVKFMGENAFTECDNLPSVVLPRWCKTTDCAVPQELISSRITIYVNIGSGASGGALTATANGMNCDSNGTVLGLVQIETEETMEQEDFKKDAKLVKAPPMKRTGKATAADKPMSEADYRKFLEQGYKIGARNQLAPNEESRCAGLVAAALKRHWKDCHWTEGVQPVHLELTFGPGGTLRRYRIVRSSGDAQVDRSVLAAAKATGSVPGLTPDFIRKYSSSPFVLEMRPIRQ